MCEARRSHLSTAPTCEACRRDRHRTAANAQRHLLAPRPHTSPCDLLRRPRPRSWPLPPNGRAGVWYASNKEQGAWAELFRHFVDDGVDPFEVRRRVGRVAVTLQVLDLTDERTRSHLGVDETDLLSDDYTTTQAIAAARDANFDAVLAPAAALPGCQTLAVFVHALPNIEPERSEVRQPPPRLANLLPLIRPHEHMPDSVRRLLATLTRAGAEAIRRRRR